ncbi:MAG: hypothetical protein JOZ75_06200 [Candidatus Dormibacteraeota bacterium]|nr:hypothetical protein [Candidatus Dormibacteraeota bacterium]
MSDSPAPDDYAGALRDLRRLADEDFWTPGLRDHEPGRHQSDLAELGLRVTVTRARYPNRSDGVDQYAVTMSRTTMDRPPDATDVRLVMDAAFGESAARAVERSALGSKVRLFRVPADVDQDSSS